MLVRERDSAKRNPAARIPARRAGQIPEGVPFGAATPLSVSEATAATRIVQDSTAAETASVIASGIAAPSAKAIPDVTPSTTGRVGGMTSSMPCSDSSCAASASWRVSCSATSRARDGARPLRS